MLNNVIKNLSILKKFLFINFLFFLVIGILTVLYLKNVQPNLIKKKSANHINVINNTIDNILRLDVNLNKRDIQKFLTSTRFLFQNLDRVIFFDNELKIIFSKSIIGKDSCNTYHVKIENSGNFNAKNCIKKVYLTGFTPSK